MSMTATLVYSSGSEVPAMRIPSSSSGASTPKIYDSELAIAGSSSSSELRKSSKWFTETVIVQVEDELYKIDSDELLRYPKFHREVYAQVPEGVADEAMGQIPSKPLILSAIRKRDWEPFLRAFFNPKSALQKKGLRTIPELRSVLDLSERWSIKELYDQASHSFHNIAFDLNADPVHLIGYARRYHRSSWLRESGIRFAERLKSIKYEEGVVIGERAAFHLMAAREAYKVACTRDAVMEVMQNNAAAAAAAHGHSGGHHPTKHNSFDIYFSDHSTAATNAPSDSRKSAPQFPLPPTTHTHAHAHAHVQAHAQAQAQATGASSRLPKAESVRTTTSSGSVATTTLAAAASVVTALSSPETNKGSVAGTSSKRSSRQQRLSEAVHEIFRDEGVKLDEEYRNIFQEAAS